MCQPWLREQGLWAFGWLEVIPGVMLVSHERCHAHLVRNRRGRSIRRRATLATGLQGLRKLAAQRLAQEKAGQTLQATALVHEAYLRLVNTEKAQLYGRREPS